MVYEGEMKLLRIYNSRKRLIIRTIYFLSRCVHVFCYYRTTDNELDGLK